MTRQELERKGLSKDEQIDFLLAMVNKLENTVRDLQNQILDLRAKCNMNSQNSSKPPSSDGVKKPAPKSLRKPTGRSQGGQKGHKGHSLKITVKPEKIEPCKPQQCESCPKANECSFNVIDRRYVVDIKIVRHCTEYQQMAVNCPMRSDERLVGQFPAHVTGSKQYGLTLKALLAVLSVECCVSYAKISAIAKAITGLPVSRAFIHNTIASCQNLLDKPLEYIKRGIMQSDIVHFDETGLRVDGKLHYLHNASTSKLTYQTVSSYRGQKGMDEAGILPYFHGIAIHDCWASYWRYDDVRHGLCCAHLLRECEGLSEMYPTRGFFRLLSHILLMMKEAKEKRLAKGKVDAGAYYTRKFKRLLDNLIAVGKVENPPPESKSKRGRKLLGKAAALVKRVEEHMGEVCLFFHNFSVPFDNNRAEQDLRHVKVKLKVSGCFRTENGAKLFASLLSYLESAKKSGHNAFESMTHLFQLNPLPMLT